MQKHWPHALIVLAMLPLAAVVATAHPSGAAPSESPRTSSRIPPDPPPMFERGQWILDLRWDKGDVYLLAVHRLDLPAPQLTPRAMGRFALELFEGPTLIERVRFDFPLLGAGDVPDAGRGSPPSLVGKLRTRIGVMFPATSRGTKLELWDRATDRRWPLPWPLNESPRAAPDQDGGGSSTAARDGG